MDLVAARPFCAQTKKPPHPVHWARRLNEVSLPQNNAETVPPAHALVNISLDIRRLEFRQEHLGPQRPAAGRASPSAARDCPATATKSTFCIDSDHHDRRRLSTRKAQEPPWVTEQHPSAAFCANDCRKQKGRPESRPVSSDRVQRHLERDSCRNSDYSRCPNGCPRRSQARGDWAAALKALVVRASGGYGWC